VEQLLIAALAGATGLYLLHLSLYEGRWTVSLAGAAVPAALALLAHSWVLDQDLAGLGAAFQGREAVTTFATLLVADSLLGALGIAARFRRIAGVTLGAGWRALLHLPPLGIVPAVLAAQAWAFFVVSGREFIEVALLFSISVLAMLLVAPALLRRLVRESELRLELRMLLTAVQLGVAVAMTIVVSRLPVTTRVAAPEYAALLALAGGACVLFLAGYLRYRLVLRRN